MRLLFNIINPQVSHTSVHLRGFRSDGFSYAGRMEVSWRCLSPHTSVQYEARLKRVVADINANLDVEGLCQRLPDRLQKLVDAKGDRLKH